MSHEPDSRDGGPPEAGSLSFLLRDVGVLLHVPAAMAAVSIPVAVLTGDNYAVPILLASALAGSALAQLLFRVNRDAREGSTPLSMATVALTWLLTALFGAAVLYGMATAAGADAGESRVYTDGWSAAFEGMSGITSTGLTMVTREAELPAIVQWWRTLLQWVGGVGVVVFGLALLNAAQDEAALYQAATRERSLGSDVQSTARRIGLLFVGMTVGSIAAFAVVGMPWWEAVNHGMTGIATGGFTVTSDSFAGYSTAIQVVALVVMTLGAVSFAAHQVLFAQRRLLDFARRSEVRALAAGLLTGAVVLSGVNASSGPGAPPALDSVFQWFSALATCGFSSTRLSGWAPSALLVLLPAMVIGGSSGSTAGGYKQDRAVTLAKALRARLAGVWRDADAEGAYDWRGSSGQTDGFLQRYAAAASMGVLWVLTLAAGTLVLGVLVEPDRPLSDLLFDATSALGSVGLSTGVVSADLAWDGKLTFILLMWMGRLEILAVLVLLQAPLRVARRRTSA